MVEPTGYSALDLIGFTDRGPYAANVNYVKNDLVHHGGDIWRVLIDDTMGITPTEGLNYTLFIGEPTNLVERIIAPLETNPATIGYTTGRQIIYNDYLYEVISDIAIGDSLITYETDPTNANIKLAPPVETQLLAVKAEADATDNMIAPTEASASSSSAPYSVGDQLILNNILYDVIAAIQIGDALTTGTGGNIAAADTLTDQLAAKANRSELTTQISAIDTRVDNIEDNYQSVKLYHNIPRLVPKDITSYITDGTFYKRLNGTDGFELFEDIYVGDYIQMSRAISAYERTGQYQATGSQYVTIAGLDTRMGDGDGGDSVSVINYHHAVMVPGQGFVGTQHFGRSRMNSSNDTTGGYVGSEMFTTTIGAVASSGSTASTASINQQLYAEFGSHLKTTRELLSNAMEGTRYNRFGQAGGAASGWAWTSCQAVLMSEVEVYGSIAWSSSGYDTGNGNIQLPLFQHNKQAMNNRSAYYWLKDVASAAGFCFCSAYGNAGYNAASAAGACVRPRFILA